jgi:DNA-binding MarR family transcriptional regulator
LPGASRAVLEHLALTGPLTIGEAAQHLQRAQSVVSEIVDGLERKALLARIRDPRDRRRTLVWLTDAGLALLDEDRQVLSRALLEQALARMSGDDRARLIDAVESLLHADDAAATPGTTNRRRTR